MTGVEIGLVIAGLTLLLGLLTRRTRWGWLLVWVALAIIAVLLAVYGREFAVDLP